MSQPSTTLSTILQYTTNYSAAMCSADSSPPLSRWLRSAPALASRRTHGSETRPGTKRRAVLPSASTASMSLEGGFVGFFSGAPPGRFVLCENVFGYEIGEECERHAGTNNLFGQGLTIVVVVGYTNVGKLESEGKRRMRIYPTTCYRAGMTKEAGCLTCWFGFVVIVLKLNIYSAIPFV